VSTKRYVLNGVYTARATVAVLPVGYSTVAVRDYEYSNSKSNFKNNTKPKQIL